MAWEFITGKKEPELKKPDAIKFVEAICKIHNNPRPVVFVLLDENSLPTMHFFGGLEDKKEMSRILNDIALTIKKASLAMAGE